MSNARKYERREEIAALHEEGRQAFRDGKGFHTYRGDITRPLDKGHWLDGWHEAYQEAHRDDEGEIE